MYYKIWDRSLDTQINIKKKLFKKDEIGVDKILVSKKEPYGTYNSLNI